MRRFTIFASCVAAAGLLGCGGSSGGGGGGEFGNDNAALRGVVTDADGNALEGVFVTTTHFDGGDSVSTSTDASGQWKLDVESGRVTVSFLETGRVTVRKKAIVGENGRTFLPVSMVAQAGPFMLNPALGGMIEGPRGASIEMPVVTFQTISDEPYDGMVGVFLTPLDPSIPAELDAYPAPLDATDDGSVLESFGMIEVDFRTEDGSEALQMMGRPQVNIRVPAGESIQDLPETIPLWHNVFDEWTQSDQVATRDGETNMYTGTVEHFSSWNLDRATEATCVRGDVANAQGDPLEGVFIQVLGVDYAGVTSGYSEADGQFCVVARKDSQVEVRVFGRDGVYVSADHRTGTEDTQIPPVCDDERCTDAGDFVVADQGANNGANNGGNNGGQGIGGACRDEVQAVDPCLGGLADIIACWDPRGECSLDGQDLVWENGARFSETGFFGPGGVLCATLIIDDESQDVTYRNPQGMEWIIRGTESEEDDQVFVCPDGKEVVVTPAQGSRLEAACGMESQESCFDDNNFGGGMCTSPADCGSGQVCCDFSDQGAEVMLCVPEASCMN